MQVFKLFSTKTLSAWLWWFGCNNSGTHKTYTCAWHTVHCTCASYTSNLFYLTSIPTCGFIMALHQA